MSVLGRLSLALAVLFVITGTLEADGRRPRLFGARLTPTQEVPALSTPANGWFWMLVDERDETVRYLLRYEGFTSEVRQAHIHLAQAGVNGGIMVWLCGSATNPGPTGTPACPATEGDVWGELTPAQVIGPAGQGIAAGEFAEFIHAVRNGVGYANVHSATFGPGEIRGQLSAVGR
jgi:hypothetical protein